MTGDILEGIDIYSGHNSPVIILFQYNTVDKYRCS